MAEEDAMSILRDTVFSTLIKENIYNGILVACDVHDNCDHSPVSAILLKTDNRHGIIIIFHDDYVTFNCSILPQLYSQSFNTPHVVVKIPYEPMHSHCAEQLYKIRYDDLDFMNKVDCAVLNNVNFDTIRSSITIRIEIINALFFIYATLSLYRHPVNIIFMAIYGYYVVVRALIYHDHVMFRKPLSSITSLICTISMLVVNIICSISRYYVY